MRSFLILLPIMALAGLSACAKPDVRPGDAATAPTKPLTISYETGPCFGRCPIYKFTVSSDGTGEFTGIRNTEVTGTRSFTVDGAAFHAFVAALAPYRPAGDRRITPGTSECTHAATDMPSVKIAWTGRGPDGALDYYYGCDMGSNRDMADALGNAPGKLPLHKLIGAQP